MTTYNIPIIGVPASFDCNIQQAEKWWERAQTIVFERDESIRSNFISSIGVMLPKDEKALKRHKQQLSYISKKR